MEWHKVHENNLPEIDELVWLYNHCSELYWVGGRAKDNYSGELCWGQTYGSFWHNGKNWEGDITLDHGYQPTHWMKLPEPPKQEE